MTIIIISKLVDFGSSTMRSILMISYLVLGTSSGCSLLRSRCCVNLLYKQRLQMLIYILISRATSSFRRLVSEFSIYIDV